MGVDANPLAVLPRQSPLLLTGQQKALKAFAVRGATRPLRVTAKSLRALDPFYQSRTDGEAILVGD